MNKLGTVLRLITLVALILVTLTATGVPQPAEAQMSCMQYCRTVCIANGETCCFISPTSCGCC